MAYVMSSVLRTDSDLYGCAAPNTEDMHGLGPKTKSSGLIHLVDRGGEQEFLGVRLDGNQFTNVLGFQTQLECFVVDLLGSFGKRAPLRIKAIVCSLK